MEQSDDELISRYRSGDPEAFQDLIGRYLDPIYAFVYRLTGKPDEASDIAQETFVKVWKTLPRYRTEGTFKPWIFRVARNSAIDHLRKKRVALFSDFEDREGRNQLVETLADEEELPDVLIDRARDHGLLEEALQSLSPEDREILDLHYGEGMTFDAIGSVVNKPLNTVKSRHRRAILKLKEFLSAKEG